MFNYIYVKVECLLFSSNEQLDQMDVCPPPPPHTDTEVPMEDEELSLSTKGHRTCRRLVPFPVIYKIPVHQIPVAVQEKVAKKQVLNRFDRSQLLGVIYNHITTTYVRGL